MEEKKVSLVKDIEILHLQPVVAKVFFSFFFFFFFFFQECQSCAHSCYSSSETTLEAQLRH